MKKFSMGKAWSIHVAMMKDHGLMAVAINAIAYIAIGAVIFAVIGAAASSIMNMEPGDNAALNALITANMGSITLLVPIVFILYFAATFATWRVILSRGEETVTGAIGYGLVASLPVLLAIVALYVAFIIAIIILAVIASLILGGSAALMFQGSALENIGAAGIIIIAISTLGSLLAMLFIYARLATTGPIMAAQRSYNPFKAMKASWQMTRNNSIRLMLYLVVVSIAIFVVYYILQLFAGLSIALSPILGGILAAIIFLLYSVFQLFIPAAVHDSLVDFDTNIEEVFN